jgi:hypothetical protein
MIFNVNITDAEGAVCSQRMAMAVDAIPCLFTLLVWGAVQNNCNLTNPPAGSFNGNSFSFSGVGGVAYCDDAFGPFPARGKCVGTATYNGPALVGNLFLESIDVGTSGVTVTVLQNGIPVAGAFVGTFPGTNYPFAIADTGGIPNTITVEVTWNAGAPEQIAGSVSGNGTITCT